ncbi:MAG: hypothetical protein ACTSX1_05070 [Candidatus Heimdallarchaeaceae archaeon]
MPGNTVKVNDSDQLEWYVGDSKMDELTEWLENNGLQTKDSNLVETEPDSVESFKGKVLQEWIEELIYPGKSEDFIQQIESSNDPVKGEWKMKFSIFTNEHRYHIVAIDRRDDGGYLGCQVSTRKYRAGEDHLRGNDLPDGPFERNTWNRILNAIIRYELVQLSPYRRPDQVPDDIVA